MSKDVFVFIELKENAPRKASMEGLSKGKEIAGLLGSQVYGVLIGHNTGNAVEAIKGFCDKIVVVDNDVFAEYRYDTYTAAFEAIVKKYSPAFVFGSSTATGKDLFPRLAACLGAAAISDAIGIELSDGAVRFKKPLFGGKIISQVECKGDDTVLATFRPNSFSVVKSDLAGEVIEEQIVVVHDERVKTMSVEKAAVGKVDLQEADFIISGGRGMGGPEAFGTLEEIADFMGGRVGASRAAVDSKWRDYEEQVGKSGKTVSPKLYMACGISGALHHTMGMDTSKVIVAINKDEKAPIFQCADYGIAGDLSKVLPVLKEELKKAREEG